MDVKPQSSMPSRTAPGRPEPIHPGDAPLWPKHLVDIFIRPTRFFSSQLALGKTPYVVVVTWCFGIAHTMDRIDQYMLRAELGRPRPGWEHLAPLITESWLGYWAVVLVLGSISGFFLWWLGGWWYTVRLRWSGEREPDRTLARLVYVYSSFVWSGPIVIAALIMTAYFANYQEAWNADELYSVGLLIFPFWSLITSYRGATTLFNLSRGRARLWFVILPAIFYLVVFGFVAALVATVTR